MASYATPADMALRFDTRTLGDLCSDDGSRVSSADLDADERLLTALSTASGRVKAAILRGDRYTTDQIATLTGESLEYLKDLTCRVAFAILWRRKPHTDDQQRQDALTQAEELLEMLRKGDHVFEIDAAITAGRADINTVTRSEMSDWNLVADRCRGRFYPARRSYKNY